MVDGCKADFAPRPVQPVSGSLPRLIYSTSPLLHSVSPIQTGSYCVPMSASFLKSLSAVTSAELGTVPGRAVQVQSESIIEALLAERSCSLYTCIHCRSAQGFFHGTDFSTSRPFQGALLRPVLDCFALPIETRLGASERACRIDGCRRRVHQYASKPSLANGIALHDLQPQGDCPA